MHCALFLAHEVDNFTGVNISQILKLNAGVFMCLYAHSILVFMYLTLNMLLLTTIGLPCEEITVGS